MNQKKGTTNIVKPTINKSIPIIFLFKLSSISLLFVARKGEYLITVTYLGFK